MLSCLEHQPPTPARASVIWLHGLGADGHDFAGIVPELRLAPQSAIRFVFPHAPAIPVTCNFGQVMPAWYDILVLDGLSREVDAEGVMRSCRAVRALIEREIERGIPAERIVLAGFSQGGAIAYATALSHPQRLGGLIALSTYLPLPAALQQPGHELLANPANQALPIFAAHGRYDEVVPLALGEAARDTLSAHGYQPAWHTYPMPHAVCAEEIADIGHWLNALLANSEDSSACSQ